MIIENLTIGDILMVEVNAEQLWKVRHGSTIILTATARSVNNYSPSTVVKVLTTNSPDRNIRGFLWNLIIYG